MMILYVETAEVNSRPSDSGLPTSTGGNTDSTLAGRWQRTSRGAEIRYHLKSDRIVVQDGGRGVISDGESLEAGERGWLIFVKGQCRRLEISLRQKYRLRFHNPEQTCNDIEKVLLWLSSRLEFFSIKYSSSKHLTCRAFISSVLRHLVYFDTPVFSY